MNEPEIRKWREKYQTENTPDDDLIAAVQRFPTREHGIAAQQILTAQQRTREEQAAEEARSQHRMSFALGSRTLRWTIVAAAAAIVGAIAALIGDFAISKTSPVTSAPASPVPSPEMTNRKSVSPRPAAEIRRSTPAAAQPATATPSPNAP